MIPTLSGEVSKEEMMLRLATQYPYFHRGLEINCGDGQKIRVGRRKGLNLWGSEERDFKNAWILQGVDLYIKKANPYHLPFPDDMFDFVTYPTPLAKYLVLREIYRVGNRSFRVKCQLSNIVTPQAWLSEVVNIGFRVEVFSITVHNELIMEMRK